MQGKGLMFTYFLDRNDRRSVWELCSRPRCELPDFTFLQKIRWHEQNKSWTLGPSKNWIVPQNRERLQPASRRSMATWNCTISESTARLRTRRKEVSRWRRMERWGIGVSYIHVIYRHSDHFGWRDQWAFHHNLWVKMRLTGQNGRCLMKRFLFCALLEEERAHCDGRLAEQTEGLARPQIWAAHAWDGRRTPLRAEFGRWSLYFLISLRYCINKA